MWEVERSLEKVESEQIGTGEFWDDDDASCCPPFAPVAQETAIRAANTIQVGTMGGELWAG